MILAGAGKSDRLLAIELVCVVEQHPDVGSGFRRCEAQSLAATDHG
jgi:hypothetical protein